MTPEQLEEIYRLRDRQVSPKQIARKLGLRPAEVSAAVRDRATTAAIARAERGELNPLKSCLINASAAQHLLGLKSENGFKKEPNGMAQIIIARQDRSQLEMASFLVDYWCLGVKNAIPPHKITTDKFVSFARNSFHTFNEPGVEITLEQAWAVIDGAIAYADKLGFSPHEDFHQAKTILGKPPAQMQAIECGKDGQPCYWAGPDDDAQAVVQKLTTTVGKGNFKFTIPLL